MTPSLDVEPLAVKATSTGWEIVDARGRVRMRINTAEPRCACWSNFLAGSTETFDVTVFPDGATPRSLWRTTISARS